MNKEFAIDVLKQIGLHIDASITVNDFRESSGWLIEEIEWYPYSFKFFNPKPKVCPMGEDVFDRNKSIRLNGDFTLEQMEALTYWMKHGKPAKVNWK